MSGKQAYRRAQDLEGAQRAAAMADGNVVVAAGAGSGKTTVLAARYLRLLETGRMPSSERVHARNILVLTFTRKAAAEMYGRIHEALTAAAREAAANEADGPDLAAHLAACLSDFSQAQISTFDSFAAQVARAGSSRFGVAPDFSVDEDRASALASDLALSFILDHRVDDAMRDLVSAAGLEGARDEVLASLAVRKMSLSSPPDFTAFHAAQDERLEAMAADAREGMLAMRDAILDYRDTKTTPTSKAWLDAMNAFEDSQTEDGFLSFIASFEDLRKPGTNSKDEASVFLSDCVPGLKTTAESYRTIAATRQAHPERLELFQLLDEFRALWDDVRRTEKTLTFRDVAKLALDVLRADPSLLAHYQELFRYVMIDEFQDDDELQKDVLFLLAGGARDKLFFVGDEKQSIYLFRGADVSVFRRLAGELGAALGAEAASPREALNLSRNYRSEPGVIDMINRIFPTVMAPREGLDHLEDFEARFEALESRDATPGVEPRFLYLELPRKAADGSKLPSEGMRDAAEAEAWEVARFVRDAVENGSLIVADRKEGIARKARYEDFALLLRSTGHQVHFEKYFRLFDVPYASENACGLFSEAAACDLYYALRLALYPDDRNALAAYLRSPFAGLSDEAVVILLASPPDPLSPEASSLLSEGDRPAWERGATTMAALAAMADKAAIATCLSFLWYEAGYRSALLLDPVASAFEEHFELVHTLAVKADARGEGLAAFVAVLEGLVGTSDKLEVELPRDSSRGVRIMTIHKSKGLEFPVVIIPQANNVGQDRDARNHWHWEDDIGPSFRPPATVGSRSRNAFFDMGKERRAAMEGAELKRLLYVALTRAESHIVVTAVQPHADDGKGKSFRSLLSGPLGLFATPPGIPVGVIPERSDQDYFALVAGARRRGETAVDFSAIPLIERCARPLSTSVTSIAARSAAMSAGELPQPADSLEVPTDLAPPRGLSPETWGSLVHAVLESRLDPRQRELKLVPALEDALESSLGGAASIQAAMAVAERLTDVFLRSELGRRALASGERHVELKVAIGMDGGARRARGSIDLAFVEAEKVVVVDYKTDAAVSTGAHDLQVAAYKRAASEIFGLPAEAWVFYLYGGGRAIDVDEDGLAPRLEDAPLPIPVRASDFIHS